MLPIRIVPLLDSKTLGAKTMITSPNIDNKKIFVDHAKQMDMS